MSVHCMLGIAVFAACAVGIAQAAESLRNDRYTLDLAADGVVTIQVAGMPPQRLWPEFTVLWTETDPHCTEVNDQSVESVGSEPDSAKPVEEPAGHW